MSTEIFEALLNFVYFAVGLAVGVFGLWQNQRFFLAQQQDKFDEINRKLAEIQERLSLVSESMSERTHEREMRYFGLMQALLDPSLQNLTNQL